MEKTYLDTAISVMQGGSLMIVTNLSTIHGYTIQKTLGLAFGYSSVRTVKGKDMVSEPDGSVWEWKDEPENFEKLFKSAEARLVGSGAEMGGEAIINVEGKITRDKGGRPEIMLVGTVVITEEGIGDGGISINYDGESSSWEPPSATPDLEILKTSKGRGKSGEAEDEDDTAQILEIGEGINIPASKMENLMVAGFRTLEDLSNASTKEIKSIEGFNPTQARLIRKRAKEMMEDR